MSRTFGEAACLQLDAFRWRTERKTHGADLAGDELGFPGSLFCRTLIGRAMGWHITVHAGECRPESIWQADSRTGAERIGIQVEDRALMDFLHSSVSVLNPV